MPRRGIHGLVLLALLSVASLSVATAGAFAQSPQAGAGAENTPAMAVESGRTQLDGIIATLRRDSLDDATLQALRAQVDPIQSSVQEAIAQLAPRVDAAKARLAQLGAKPDEKAPPEAATVTADRDTQQGLLNGSEDLLKRARLLALQADQISGAITARRRAAFLKDLFERSPGVFSPALWREVGGDLPA